MVTGGEGEQGQSGKGLRGGWLRSKSRDFSKIRYHRCDELGYQVKDCPQVKDQIKTIAVVIHGSNAVNMMRYL